MVTVEVASTPRALREFYDLPPRIYSAFPEYQPPLRMDRQMMLDPKSSPFFKRGRACYWLARLDGLAVGRVSAQVDSRTPVGIEPDAGMFGCLDAIDDADVVSALLNAARQWLLDQGCTSVFGPCTLDMNNEPGLLVEGADQPAMTLAPWHPPYLQTHLERLGFAKLRDLHNWRLDLRKAPPRSPGDRMRLAERLPGLRIRHPTRRSYAKDIQILCDVYNDGWRNHWGFIPLTPADLAGLDQLMIWLVPREAFKIVELDGKAVAVMLLIPNLFELNAGLGHAPGPAGWIKLVWRALRHRFRSGRVIVMGITLNLQRTVIGSAIAALLVDELIAGQAILKGEWVEAGWVLENNDALVQILDRFQFQRTKTFRIYGRKLEPLAAWAEHGVRGP